MRGLVENLEDLEELLIQVENKEKLKDDAKCCICKKKLRLGDEMQETPCKNLFHPFLWEFSKVVCTCESQQRFWKLF